MEHTDSTLKRKCHGIWIPIDIWENENLTLQEKVLLAEIHSFDNGDGCWASNKYFAKFLGISKDRAGRVVSSLVEKGLISSKLIYTENTKQIIRRYLRVISVPPIGENADTPIGENADTPIGENADTPIGENAVDINIKIINKENIKKINGDLPSEASPKDINKAKMERRCKKIILHLNKVTGKAYRLAPGHTKFISARLKEGYTVQDCIKVIDTKSKDPYFQANDFLYMRPKTLFNSENFDTYLNQDPTKFKAQTKSNTPTNGSGVSGRIDYDKNKVVIKGLNHED